jgi:Tfp pilus assembly protein PilF
MIVLAIFSGCATAGNSKLKSLGKGTSVMRLKDGREGFIIRETPNINGESRRDFERAAAMMKDRNYDQAIILLEKVIENAPGVTAPHINIAMAYIQTDKLEPAEQHLKAALSLVPDHPAASNEYGMLLRKSGRFAEARQIYEKALTSFPEYLPVHKNLGILCDLYLNDHACALKQYEIYSKAKPDDEQVKMWLADLRMRTGR